MTWEEVNHQDPRPLTSERTHRPALVPVSSVGENAPQAQCHGRLGAPPALPHQDAQRRERPVGEQGEDRGREGREIMLIIIIIIIA